MRHLSFVDKTIISIDVMIKHAPPRKDINLARTNPSKSQDNNELMSEQELQQSIAMMRINHSGEVCAQALYQGQALMAKSTEQKTALLQAAAEETDHLTWCQQRLQELNGRPSLLNPVWYAGSFGIGALAGLAGDKLSLGFISETEHQVSKHLDTHLAKMSPKDQKSRAILEQMRIDELQHATQAEQAGGRSLPLPIKLMMKVTAKILTITAAKI